MNQRAFPLPTLLRVHEHSERLRDRVQHQGRRLRTQRVWLRGEVSQACHQARQPAIAIVGTRRPSSYGIRFVRDFVPRLKGYGVTIISGGAYGIDGEVHAAALRAGISTHAWLVGPVRAPSPRRHERLFEAIGQQPGGALWVPECLEPQGPQVLRPYHWLERNQWLTAAADLLIVVEARRPSGTWSSVQAAGAFGIPVYLLPGPIDSPSNEGTNKMISEGYGQPILNSESLLKSCVVDLVQDPYNKRRGLEHLSRLGGEAISNLSESPPSGSTPEEVFLSKFHTLTVNELLILGEHPDYPKRALWECFQRQLQGGLWGYSGDRFERRGT